MRLFVSCIVLISFLLPFSRSEVVSTMVTCKYENYCYPCYFFNNTDCMSYENSNECYLCEFLFVVPKCSNWKLSSFESIVRKVSSIQVCDGAIHDDVLFTINTTTAILIPLSFFPSQDISLRFSILDDIISDHRIYFSDSSSLDYSAMYEMKYTDCEVHYK